MVGFEKLAVEKQYFTATDVMKIMGCSRCIAYGVIKQCNNELKAKGKITIRGKVNAKYFMDRVGL